MSFAYTVFIIILGWFFEGILILKKMTALTPFRFG